MSEHETVFSWLIDNGDQAIGMTTNKFRFLPYTDEAIIRFSREEDAERVIQLLRASSGAENFKAVEHGFGG